MKYFRNGRAVNRSDGKILMTVGVALDGNNAEWIVKEMTRLQDTVDKAEKKSKLKQRVGLLEQQLASALTRLAIVEAQAKDAAPQAAQGECLDPECPEHSAAVHGLPEVNEQVDPDELCDTVQTCTEHPACALWRFQQRKATTTTAPPERVGPASSYGVKDDGVTLLRVDNTRSKSVPIAIVGTSNVAGQVKRELNNWARGVYPTPSMVHVRYSSWMEPGGKIFLVKSVAARDGRTVIVQWRMPTTMDAQIIADELNDFAVAAGVGDD